MTLIDKWRKGQPITLMDRLRDVGTEAELDGFFEQLVYDNRIDGDGVRQAIAHRRAELQKARMRGKP